MSRATHRRAVLLLGLLLVVVLGCAAGQRRALNHFAAAEAALDAGELARARAEYQLALAAEPRLARAHHGLALTYIAEKNYPLAAQHLRKCLELDALNIDARLDLAELYRMSRQYRKAVEENLRVLFQVPNTPRALRNLGILYAKHLYHYRYARYYFEKYLELVPEAPDRDEIELWMAEVDAELAAARRARDAVTAATGDLPVPPEEPVVDVDSAPPAAFAGLGGPVEVEAVEPEGDAAGTDPFEGAAAGAGSAPPR